jgi:hypothetical protein
MFGVGPLEPRSCTPPFARVVQNADQVRKFRHRAAATARSIMRAKPDEDEGNLPPVNGDRRLTSIRRVLPKASVIRASVRY